MEAQFAMIEKFLSGINRKDILFLCTIAILLVIRKYLGRLASVLVFPNQLYDDAWFLQSANLNEHFLGIGQPWYLLMIKNIGYSVFLFAVKLSGLHYTDVMTLLWFFAAISFIYLFKLVTNIKSHAVYALIFSFILFSPLAFDSVTGIRVYRNGALIPFYFLVLSMMGIIFARHFANHRRPSAKLQIVFQLIFGFLFTWTYYMKEDGLWLLCCLSAILLLCTIKILLQYPLSSKTCLSQLVILFIPIFVFTSGTIAYKSVNEKYFGLYETNNRTAGELGEFVKNVYKIKSSERTSLVWAPADAIQKTFAASATLNANEKLKYSIMHSRWFGNDIVDHPIKGDFLGWVMLSAFYDSETCSSVKEQEEFLRKVNDEISDAFSEGRLEKDDKIQLISSMGGRSLDEILALRHILFTQYRTYITMKGVSYTPSEDCAIKPAPDDPTDYSPLISQASQTLNMDLNQKNTHVEKNLSIFKSLFKIYAVLQVLLVIFAFLGIIRGIKRILLDKDVHSVAANCSLAIASSSFMLSLIYGIAIAWFCEFVFIDIDWAPKFYGIGMLPFLSLFEIFGSYLFFHYWRTLKKSI